MSVLSRPDTPCRGTCSHCVGDDICRGCGRTVAEVRDWPAMSPDRRRHAAQLARERKQAATAARSRAQ